MTARRSEQQRRRPAPRASTAGRDRAPAEVVVVEVTGIAADGAGVGRTADGRVVFVHRTAPGELVEARIVESRQRWARGRLLRVLRPAAERRAAPCPFYERCGGCTLEHLEYAAQLRIKAERVRETIRRIARLDVPLPEIVAAPSEFRYRNRLSFALRRLGAGAVVAGFHEIERPDRIVDVDGNCLLPEPALAEVWNQLRNEWGKDASRLPAGEQLRLTVRVTAREEASLLVEGGTSPGRPDELLSRIPALKSMWQRPRPGQEPELLAGTATLEETWSGEAIRLAGATFVQVNRGAAQDLERHVLELVGDVRGKRVLDAYCGVGLYAKRLARAGARVSGVDWDASAIREAERDAPPGVQFRSGRVEDVLDELLPVDVAIVNPPRTGLHARVTEALAARPPALTVYVSCDPATLARDLARLHPMFAIRSLRCFDLFPQTSHVETVAELVADPA